MTNYFLGVLVGFVLASIGGWIAHTVYEGKEVK